MILHFLLAKGAFSDYFVAISKLPFIILHISWSHPPWGLNGGISSKFIFKSVLIFPGSPVNFVNSNLPLIPLYLPVPLENSPEREDPEPR